MPLIANQQEVKLPPMNIQRKVFSVKGSKQKFEVRHLNSKPKINVIQCKNQPKNPFIGRRVIIPRYVPVYNKQGRGLEKQKVNVIARWG